jgi:hypothetical protein
MCVFVEGFFEEYYVALLSIHRQIQSELWTQNFCEAGEEEFVMWMCCDVKLKNLRLLRYLASLRFYVLNFLFFFSVSSLRSKSAYGCIRWSSFQLVGGAVKQSLLSRTAHILNLNFRVVLDVRVIGCRVVGLSYGKVSILRVL